MKITVHLSPQGQRAAAVAGLPAHQVQAYLTDDLGLIARALALPPWDGHGESMTAIAADGTITLAMPHQRGYSDTYTWGWSTYGSYNTMLDQVPADAEAALDAIEQQICSTDAQLAERREEHRQEQAARAARDAETAAQWAALPLADRVAQLTRGLSVNERDALRRHQPAALAETEAAQARAKAETEAARARAKAETEAAGRIERETWIAEHGSERLQLALTLELADSVQRSYLEERLAAERPGWRRLDDCEDERDIIEPSAEALVALAQARATDPDIELVWLVTPHDLDCPLHGGGDEGECCRCEHVPGGAREALVATWLGHRIVWSVSAPQ